MNTFKQSFLSGLVFSWTVLSTFLAYAAWSDIATQNNGDTINATIWNNVVTKVNTIGNTYAPAWAIMAFYLNSCPTGWVAADGNNGTPDLRGEFIRGWDFNNKWTDSGRTLWSSQSWTVIANYAHSDAAAAWATAAITNYIQYADGVTVLSWNSNIYYYMSSAWAFNWGSPYSYWQFVRSRNIALLYCMKQ